MDAAPFCPEAGFAPPALLSTRPSRAPIILAAVAGIAIGILSVAGLVLTHPAPALRCATLSLAVERVP